MDHHHDEDDVSILADDAQRRLPSEHAIAPAVEERFNRILPPVYHVEVPVHRRRAHTVDVEYGATTRSRDEEQFFWTSSGEEDDDARSFSSLEVEEPPRLYTRTRSTQNNLGVSLSQEGRQRRRRRKLLNSRCMRGFLVLSVYGMLVLQPSTDTLLAAARPQSLDMQLDDNLSSATTSPKRTRRAASKAHLPHFHRPVYHSTMPPDAVHSTTHTNGTTIHWHKIPPNPPHVYRKKRRPILSHARSGAEQPLVFGRDEETSSFFMDDEGGDSKPWSTALIWLSLVALCIDTGYREWRWHSQFLSQPLLTPQQRRQRRSLHHRRSPSPGLQSRRRFDSV